MEVDNSSTKVTIRLSCENYLEDRRLHKSVGLFPKSVSTHIDAYILTFLGENHIDYVCSIGGPSSLDSTRNRAFRCNFFVD